jgi:hypothetical protein
MQDSRILSPSLDVESWHKVEEERQPRFSYPLLAFIFVVVMLLLANVGCTPVSSGQAAADQSAPGTEFFSDDFSDPPSGWGIWSREGAKAEYSEGGLRISVSQPQYDFWSVAGKNYEDVRVEVDAVKINGPDNNDFGILCRYLDKDNFYMLLVTSDGYYGIAKRKESQYSMIGSDQLQYTDSAIHSGKASNHLRADCIGPMLRLYANGQMLMEARDTDFANGDVGVLAGAYDTPGVDILFDNFVVKKP